ncbi:MAG: hypothetical protein JRI55_37890, partial [Deltaproteobacteria bacterium]|nr:hypothetical protein [Deltaproteobacteria bacterium]
IRSLVVGLRDAAESPLSEHDVVFLIGASEVSRDLGERLSSYVREGGGLFVAPGEPGGELRSLEGLIPGRVRSVRRVPRAGSQRRIGGINRAHPLFSPFGEGPTGLEELRVRAHLLVEPDPATERAVLAELNGGLPLIMEHRVGKGRVVFLATTVDREWTDLPIRPGYLPLVQRSARLLAGELDRLGPRTLNVGQTARIEVSRGMHRMLVRGPGGQDTSFPAVELAGEQAVAFSGTDRPGHYRVWAEVPGFGGLRELVGQGFIVGLDPLESDLTRVAEAPTLETAGEAAPVEGRLPLWPYLLVAAMLFLLAETFVAGMGLRRSHVIGGAPRSA